MQNKELFIQYQSLRRNVSEGKNFSVIPLAGTSHKLGVSKEGYPKFFLATNDTISNKPNTSLNILTVEYNLTCTLVDDLGNENICHYTVLTLRSVDDTLQEDFLDLVVMMISRLPLIPSKKEIAIEVENLISIFSSMTCPPRKKIQGLWSELLVIEQSINPETLISAWHSSPTAKYDFTLGKDKLEVKSTSSENRIHHFSLDQLIPSVHSNIVIASTIVRESGAGNGGISINGLSDKICERIDSVDAKIRLITIVAETLGTDYARAKDVYFDYVESCDKLKFYDAADVPGVDKDGVHVGVSCVGFKSDLTGAPDVFSPDSHFCVKESELYMNLFNNSKHYDYGESKK